MIRTNWPPQVDGELRGGFSPSLPVLPTSADKVKRPVTCVPGPEVQTEPIPPLAQNCLHVRELNNSTKAYENISYDELHQPRRHRCCAQTASKDLLKTRRVATDQIDRKREKDANAGDSPVAKIRHLLAKLHTTYVLKGIAEHAQ